MGSSGGSSNYEQPAVPTPPNVAPYGSSVPFKPSFINFLGDPSTPSTGLTPDMLAAIDQMYQNRPSIGVQAPPQQAAAPPAAKPDRNKLAQAMRGGEGSAGGRGGSAGGGGWGGR